MQVAINAFKIVYTYTLLFVAVLYIPVYYAKTTLYIIHIIITLAIFLLSQV